MQPIRFSLTSLTIELLIALLQVPALASFSIKIPIAFPITVVIFVAAVATVNVATVFSVVNVVAAPILPVMDVAIVLFSHVIFIPIINVVIVASITASINLCALTAIVVAIDFIIVIVI